MGQLTPPAKQRGETQRTGRGNGLQPCPVVTTRLVEASANRLAEAFSIYGFLRIYELREFYEYSYATRIPIRTLFVNS